VVYSWGAIVHKREPIISYAMADQSSRIATVPLNDLLDVFCGR